MAKKEKSAAQEAAENAANGEQQTMPNPQSPKAEESAAKAADVDAAKDSSSDSAPLTGKLSDIANHPKFAKFKNQGEK